MPTYQDLHIFVTGVVGRSMGSGKFDLSSLLTLTERAKDAFTAVFGEPQAIAAQPPARVGTAHSVGSVAAEVVGGNTVRPEPNPISMWGGDKAYLGMPDWEFEGKKMQEVTWGEWLEAAGEGNATAKKRLTYSANKPVSTGQWATKDASRIGKAKAILAMLATGYRSTKGDPSLAQEDAPF